MSGVMWGGASGSQGFGLFRETARRAGCTVERCLRRERAMEAAGVWTASPVLGKAVHFSLG